MVTPRITISTIVGNGGLEIVGKVNTGKTTVLITTANKVTKEKGQTLYVGVENSETYLRQNRGLSSLVDYYDLKVAIGRMGSIRDLISIIEKLAGKYDNLFIDTPELFMVPEVRLLNFENILAPNVYYTKQLPFNTKD